MFYHILIFFFLLNDIFLERIYLIYINSLLRLNPNHSTTVNLTNNTPVIWGPRTTRDSTKSVPSLSARAACFLVPFWIAVILKQSLLDGSGSLTKPACSLKCHLQQFALEKIPDGTWVTHNWLKEKIKWRLPCWYRDGRSWRNELLGSEGLAPLTLPPTLLSPSIAKSCLAGHYSDKCR